MPKHEHKVTPHMRASLMTRAAWERVAGVCILLGVLWLLVAWALEGGA